MPAPDTLPLAIDRAACPLCGKPNGCGLEAQGDPGVGQADGGVATCWCSAIRVAPRSLQALPATLRGQACLCGACAAGAAG